MTPVEETILLQSDGLTLPASFQTPGPGAPAVVMSHGLESTKDGDGWPELAIMLRAHGIASLRLTHRGCRWGPEPRAAGRIEDTTLSGRIADLRAALDHLAGMDVDQDRIAGVGNSFGGMVLLGAQDPRIKVMVLQASPFRLAGRNSRMPALGPDAAQYDLLASIAAYRRPTLIIHGGADQTVPVEHAHRLYEAAGEPRRLEVIAGADHVFSGSGQRERVLALALDWMQTHL